MGKKCLKSAKYGQACTKEKGIDFWTLVPSASFTFGLLCWKLLHLMKVLKPQNLMRMGRLISQRMTMNMIMLFMKMKKLIRQRMTMRMIMLFMKMKKKLIRKQSES